MRSFTNAKAGYFLFCLLLLPQLAFAGRTSPVDGGTVTSGIGLRLDPFGSGRMVHHNGYDISVPVGTRVYPTQIGTVYFAGNYKGYGNLVVVEHGQGYLSLYGHNSELLVKAGDKVDTTTVIALSGSTGRSTGPHVHYEIRQLPSLAKAQREQLQKSVRSFALKNVEELVDNFVQGKGGGELGSLLPTDLDE